MNTIQSDTVETVAGKEFKFATPEDRCPGLKIEHILLSVTVVHNREISQFDDSCAQILERKLLEYDGVLAVDAEALHTHGNTVTHVLNCDCHWCATARA